MVNISRFSGIFNQLPSFLNSSHPNIQLKNLYPAFARSRILYFWLFVFSTTVVCGFRPAPLVPRAPTVQKVRKTPSYANFNRAPLIPSSKIARKAPVSPRAPIARHSKLVKRPPTVIRPKPVRSAPVVQRVPVFKRVPFVRRVPKRI